MQDIKDLLFKSRDYAEFQQKIDANTKTIEAECDKHGLTAHSQCLDSTFCLKCLLERRYGIFYT